MRQTRTGRYRCGLGCCNRSKPHQHNGKKLMRLPASRSKKTKGYKVHLDAVKAFLDSKVIVVEETGLHRARVSRDTIARELNINIGYVKSCLAMLKTQGVCIHGPDNGLPHDHGRGEERPTYYKGYSGWCPSLYCYYPNGLRT